MNNKLLSVILVAGIASTGFAALSSADSTATGNLLGNRQQIESLLQKIEAGETLTADEQAKLDAVKSQFGEKGGKRGFDGHGKRAGFAKLTDEEKASLESMTDAEKKAFFDAKKAEMEAERTAHKAVIDKLIAGETLTAAEEATRLEMVNKFSEEDNEHPERRYGGDIIAKLVAGDTLTDAEKIELTEMQARHAEREAEKAKIDAMTDTERQAYFEAKKAEMDAKMEIVKPLLEKQRNGETLSDAEKQTLEDNKPDMPFGGPGRGHGPRGGHGEMDDMPEVSAETAQ